MQADVLGERARLTPDAPALVVVEPALRLSYAELDQRAIDCARVWTETLGLKKGDRVGILAHNRVEYLAAFFAAGKTGIILVTLGTRLTAPELEHVIADSGLRVLMYDHEAASVLSELRSRSAVEAWLALDEPVNNPDSDPDDPGQNDLSYADLSYAEAVKALAPDGLWRRTRCCDEDVYCLLYTSGTTGRPKGVMIPHRMVISNGFNTVCGWQLQSDDVTSIFTPLYHAGGLAAFLVPIFMIGGTVVLHRAFDADEIWQTAEREGVTVALGVPTIWKMLLESAAFRSADLSKIRWLISGGAPLPRYLIDAYQELGIPFKQGFGMTEAGVNCFAMTVDDSVRKAGSIGKPLMYTEARLVDAAGRDVPEGEVGELLFRGNHVCLGYWKNPEATVKAFDAEGWFHSGDQACRDSQGFYYIAGRSKDMIISGGVNIYPAEIEAVLVRHPRIEDAAVVSVPDEKWGELGVAYVILRTDSESDSIGQDPSEDLRDFLAEHLARFKIPSAFRVLEALPRTAYGKVVKGDLRDRFMAEPA